MLVISDWLPRGQVLGAVGRVVRMERCERVQLITAAARLIVSSCHDCILYLGVNHAPLLIGDNRFIQARAASVFAYGALRMIAAELRRQKVSAAGTAEGFNASTFLLIAVACKLAVLQHHLLLGSYKQPPMRLSHGCRPWGTTLQMAPYNTQYERLGAHMEAAGVAPEPNLWDQPVSLAREHGRATPDTPLHSATSGSSPPTSLPGSPGSSSGAGSSRGPGGPPPAWSLLPPDKLLPFMIPFQGGRGHMCGGAATDANTRYAAGH